MSHERNRTNLIVSIYLVVGDAALHLRLKEASHFLHFVLIFGRFGLFVKLRYPLAGAKQHSNLSDQALIDKTVAGSQEAFAEIMRRYERLVFSRVYRMVYSIEDARELTQEVFLSAYKALSSFKAKAKLSTWLTRIAINKTLNHLRSAYTRAGAKSTSINGMRNNDNGQKVIQLENHRSNPESDAVKAENIRLVQEEVNKLDPEKRALIMLRECEELDYKEISAVLDLPLGTVKSKLARTRMELKENLIKRGVEL